MNLREKMEQQIKKSTTKKLEAHPDVKKKIKEVDDLKAAGQIVEIPIKDIIEDSSFQIRTEDIKAEDFESLKQSIKKEGLKIPVFVRRAMGIEGKYQLIAGFNRVKAFRELEIKKIIAIFNDVSDTDAFKIAEIENLERSQLSFYDMLCYIKKLEDKGLKVPQIAERLNKNRRTIELHMQVGEHEKLVQLIRDDQIGYGQAIKLIRLKPEQLNKVVNKLSATGASKGEGKKEVSKATARPSCVINEEKGTITIALKGTIRGKESLIKELKKIISDIADAGK